MTTARHDPATAPGALRSVAVLLNDRAAADPAMREALLQLRARGHRVTAALPLEPGEAVAMARDAVRQGADIVVAAGGDGTLNEVVNGVVESGCLPHCAVAVVPYGTANDFAAMCGIDPDEPARALALALENEPVAIDVGRMDDRLFINVASGGFGAQVTAETSPEAKQMLGGFAYFLKGLASVKNLTARPVEVEAPGTWWQGPALALSVGNGRQAGGGFQVCPGALLDDGLLDVVIVPEVGTEKLLALARDLLRLGRDSGFEQVVTFRTPRLEVRAPRGLQFNLDGEPVRGERFRFEVLARLLPFCLPASAPLTRGGVVFRQRSRTDAATATRTAAGRVLSRKKRPADGRR
ncbi:MAG: lipid kinase YegS [Gammaproteobacteria bacterium]